MNALYELIEKNAYGLGLNIEIYYSSILDWTIKIGFKVTRERNGELIVNVQDCDRDRAFSLAYIGLTDWLSENNGGY